MNSITIKPYTYEIYQEISEFLLSKIKTKPQIGIICGTGLGTITEAIEDRVEIPYTEVPHFPQCTVACHAGKLVFGYLGGTYVMCMKGRFHGYEGYPTWLLAMPVRVMHLCGVTHLIISNAAGGINTAFNVGDVMVMRDHINFVALAGKGPLVGPHDERWGERFPAMVKAYDRELVKKAKDFWSPSFKGTLREGVYACLGGPQFETIAEMIMMKNGGADAVGMSTAHEVTYASQLGMTVFGFTLITNMGVLDYDQEDDLKEENVLLVGQERQHEVTSFVMELVKYIVATRLNK